MAGESDTARAEVARFARLLADEIASTPLRADGAMNARDLWQALHEALKRYQAGADE